MPSVSWVDRRRESKLDTSDAPTEPFPARSFFQPLLWPRALHFQTLHVWSQERADVRPCLHLNKSMSSVPQGTPCRLCLCGVGRKGSPEPYGTTPLTELRKQADSWVAESDAPSGGPAHLPAFMGSRQERL